MAKPKACQTPNAEMTPISSNPANKPELERPFKAERCPREPGSFCGAWVGPVTAPLQVCLQPPAAAQACWRVEGHPPPPQPPVLKGRKEGAGFWQRPSAKGADLASCCVPEPRDTES